MFDDGTYKYFTAVSVLISIIYYMNTCYKLARIKETGKTLMCLLPYRASFFAAEYFICNRAFILIILRKSPASARFISLMLNLVFPTNPNDDQIEKKIQI